jgi:type II secretory pathway pseudopilin PulG
MRENMIEKLMTLLVGILLALAGWTLTRTFDLSTNQSVLLNQVNQLERHVEKLQDQMDDMQDSDEEIMDQHKKLFEKLEQGNTGYNYN